MKYIYTGVLYSFFQTYNWGSIKSFLLVPYIAWISYLNVNSQRDLNSRRILEEIHQEPTRGRDLLVAFIE